MAQLRPDLAVMTSTEGNVCYKMLCAGLEDLRDFLLADLLIMNGAFLSGRVSFFWLDAQTVVK